MINSYISEYKNDSRDRETPFKALTGQGYPQRFTNEEAGKLFYNNHKGRCLLSVIKNGKHKVLAYKYR